MHALAAALQGVVENGVAVALPSPTPAGPTAKVATLSLLHLWFVCGVAADGDPPPIWESVARGRGKMDDRLPNGGEVHIRCHLAHKAEVQKGQGRHLPRRSSRVRGRQCRGDPIRHYSLQIRCKGVHGRLCQA